ncbi:pilus assembly protein PilP [Marinicella gelatinilytica]|uniref:pilus assembly protein PilP n=1 Tax=Marinicella gelatinilytica TaxID=2996017 RepID=UPI002260BCE0|nr:pilus assembly protein PilP [Marinicella gelatinilytica]MCX7544672.1 pilus assembly protein PilP [Marinicella gelatinilytica]
MKIVYLLIMVTFLAGCQNSLDDLNEFIDRQKSKPVKPIEPLPEIKPQVVFEYHENGLRDPFSNDLEVADNNEGDQQIMQSEDGEGPDLTRRKEYLETYPLDSLVMVGTYQQKEDYWALVEDPDGTIHRVSVGHYLGHNYGEVVAISESEIQIKEWINDGLGAWREQSAAIALKEE